MTTPIEMMIFTDTGGEFPTSMIDYIIIIIIMSC